MSKSAAIAHRRSGLSRHWQSPRWAQTCIVLAERYHHHTTPSHIEISISPSFPLALSRPARTHRLDLGVVLKHDLVLVVDVAKLLLGDIHPGPGDIVDFSFLQLFIEVVDGLVEPGSFDLGLDKQQDRDQISPCFVGYSSMYGEIDAPSRPSR